MSGDPHLRFPNLFQVLGGYLHQDFDAEFDSPDAALRAAAAEHGQGHEQLTGAIREIDHLLASEISDADLMRLLERLTAGYSPELGGWEARPWLRHARDLLSAGVAA